MQDYKSLSATITICPPPLLNIQTHIPRHRQHFSACAFARTNRRVIATMFVRLSVCLSWTGVHCDHTVHVSADLSLWLDSANVLVTLTSKHVTYSQPSFFQFHLEELKGGVWRNVNWT